MTMTESHRNTSMPTAQELARAVEALAAKAVGAARAQDKAAVKQQVAHLTGRLGDTAAHVGRLVEDQNLDSVRERARRAAVTARTHRTALLAAAGVLTAAVAARRSRRARRARRPSLRTPKAA